MGDWLGGGGEGRDRRVGGGGWVEGWGVEQFKEKSASFFKSLERKDDCVE